MTETTANRDPAGIATFRSGCFTGLMQRLEVLGNFAPAKHAKVPRRAGLAVLGVVVALTACSASPPEMVTAPGVERASVATAAYPRELDSLRSSAYALGEALLSDGGDGTAGNVVASPGSLLTALVMLRAGAAGETAAELDRILALPPTNRDEAANAMLAAVERYDGDPGAVDEDNPPRKPVIHSANGLFLDINTPTGPDYLDTLARHYGTGVHKVDFRDRDTTEPAIDAWVDRNTGGRIKKAPAAFDPKNTFSILNAIYFAAAWNTPFDPSRTLDRPFTTGTGEVVDVPTMGQTVDMKYAEGEGWQAVDLPYAEGAVMRLVLPADTAPGPPAGSAVTAEQISRLSAALDAAAIQPVHITLPRWDHKTSFDLREVLGAMGLHNTLNTAEDFDAIQSGMKITQAAQAANITVAEKGTVAAAVTQINAEAVSGTLQPDVSIVFDRPFHYQIIHTETGLPLFMGKVADPRS
ncbi:serpin family protein [Arthrobacter sp. RT-1]|uniref:serpin family protein n=1 Tax=Arthrobacter sp. RT-1 TaxID=2292263 RepID=UPI002163A43E|nr:serpin family protein [Arthrobacter sp. RT-1]